MFQTGSQINPSLGRTDYSAYAQGAIAGGQAIGQGIANLGQGIASGIEQYAKQKKENKQLEAKLKGSIVALEGLGQIAKGISPEADASYTGLMAKLNDPAISTAEKVYIGEAAQGTLKEFISAGIQSNTKRDAATATNLALASAQSGKPIPSIYSPEIMAQAGKQAYEFAATQAQIDETKAKIASEGAVKPTQFNVAYGAFKRANPNPTAQQEKSFVDEYVASNKASSNTTIVNTPENKGKTAAEEVIGKATGEQYNAIGSAADAADKSVLILDRVKSLYDQGAYTGVGVGLVSGIGKFASSIGLNVPEQASQDQMEQILQEGALVRTRELFKGTGSLSNLEGSKGEQTVANLSRTPAGNIKILEWQSRNAPVLRAADDLKITLRDKGVEPEKIVSEVRKYVKNNYIKLDDVASDEASFKPINIGRFQVIEVK